MLKLLLLLLLMLLFTLATAFRVNSMKVIMLKELKPMFPTPPGHELLRNKYDYDHMFEAFLASSKY